MLPGQARELHRDTGTCGAVAGSASGHAATGVSALVDLLAFGDQAGVLGHPGFGLLCAEEGREVLHVILGQLGRIGRHGGVHADAGLEFMQLFGDVFGGLASQRGIRGVGAVAVGGVAGRAHFADDFLRLGGVALGGVGGGHAGPAIGRKHGGKQQASDQRVVFHVRCS